ncbi:hypothetical protein C1H76_1131 [Elsinoe australis]|uniref:Uncharacterized protein n=1 Tax=Elsinoe australis TaxID=40998 RepID=A0A4U7B6I8_9PEZI|nr:hypothetical protein C1H76_1131 [Elsinoe australis]
MPPKRARPGTRAATAPAPPPAPEAAPRAATRTRTTRQTAPAETKTANTKTTTKTTAGKTKKGVSRSDEEEEDVTGGLVRNARKRPQRGQGRGEKVDMFVAGGLGSPGPAKGGKGPRAGKDKAETGREGNEFDVPSEDEGEGVVSSIGKGRKDSGAGVGRGKSTGTRRSSQTKSPAARKAATPARGSARRSGSAKDSPMRRTGQKSGTKAAVMSRAPAEATPMVADSSVLALAGFQRRPRQLSILAQVQRGDLDTSMLDNSNDSLLGNTTDELGTSALDTTADLTGTNEGLDKTGSDAVGHIDDLTLDDEAFRPHLEGTPLPGRFEHTANPTKAVEEPRRQSIYEDDEELYTLSPRKSRGTKRKSDEISTSHDSDMVAETQEDTAATQRTAGGAEVKVMRSSPPAPEPRPSRARETGQRGDTISSDLSPARSASLPRFSEGSGARSSTPRRADLDSETYASPKSSSSLEEEVVISPKKRRGAPTQVQERRVTSAMLRALLPRRVVRRDESFDVSGIESDEESEFVGLKGRGKGRKVLGEAKGKKNLKVGAGKATKRGRTTKASRGDEKENADAVVELDASRKGKGATYGGRRRAEASDDEAASEDEDVEQGALSKELQAARDKFKQIDQGALDFESASISGGSSPWR